MDLVSWTERLGEPPVAALFGLLTGIVFGIAAQRSAFCLRAAAVGPAARLTPRVLIFASGVGFSVALGWVLTWTLAQIAFDPVSVSSVTFPGPSANTLMFLLESGPKLSFDVGLVPGVVIGAFVAALAGRELAFQGFDSMQSMRRLMIGAALMGFGAMLAGGCSLGAGVTGTSVFAMTAWVALFCFFLGAIAADVLLDQRGAREAA